MDNKDGRRSRVPAGTFGGSNPPPSPEEGDKEEPTLPGIRRSHRSPPPPPPSDPRKRHVSTLVGHPSSSSGGSRGQGTPPPAPMLAPPKWTGAAPYLQGEEPQPRVSSLPAPQHVPLAPVAAAEPSRSRVTTKVGHVQAPPPPIVAMPRGLPAIGDAIQEMLDGQASVPIEVEDSKPDPRRRQLADEGPLDDLQIEEILESLSEPPPPLAAEPPHARGDEPTLIHAAPPPPPPAPPPRVETAPVLLPVELTATEVSADAETWRPPATLVERDVPEGVPSRSAPAVRPAAVKAEPAPVPAVPVAAKPVAPVPVPDTAAALGEGEGASSAAQPVRGRRAASEIGIHADGGSAPALRGGASPNVTSLAPAEVSRAPRYRDDSQAGLGLLLLAAMAVIGVGGWLLTRGGYPGARPAPVPTQASAPVAPPSPAAKTVASAPAAAALPALTAATTEEHAVPPAVAATPSASVTGAPVIKRSAPKPHSGAKMDSPEPSSATQAAADQAPSEVLKVTPRDPGSMPELPTRDDVLAALAPIRAAVNECAHGQRGVAQLDITVANTGVVTHAVVGGDFAGTPEGSCIARAARNAQFVPFQKPRFRVIYPFSL
jgi:hypothetical protein